MRLRNLSLIIIILMVITLQKSTNHFEYVFLKDLENTSFLQNLTLHAKEITPSIILLPNDSFDEKAATEVIAKIDSLPIPLLEKIRAEHIKVQLFTGHLTDLSGKNSLKGITPRGYAHTNVTWDDVPGAGGGHIVYVKIGASNKGQGHGSENLELHELAHSIDRIVFEEIRDNPYFLSVWKQEVKKMFGDKEYYLLYPEEYFAETFAYFYANRDSNSYLKKHAPKTYTFIQNLQ